MAQINLKFSPEMESLVMQGRKICTTRDEPKGQIGDTFIVENRLYRIVCIDETDFDCVLPWYELEGFESEDAFVDKLEEYYPGIESGDVLYLHWFAFVALIEGE